MAPGGLPYDDLSASDNTPTNPNSVTPTRRNDPGLLPVALAQVVLSLFFAVGGLMLVLILGLILGPFIALFFLVRHLVWKPAPSSDGPPETGPPAAGGRPGDVSHP